MFGNSILKDLPISRGVFFLKGKEGGMKILPFQCPSDVTGVQHTSKKVNVWFWIHFKIFSKYNKDVESIFQLYVHSPKLFQPLATGASCGKESMRFSTPCLHFYTDELLNGF